MGYGLVRECTMGMGSTMGIGPTKGMGSTMGIGPTKGMESTMGMEFGAGCMGTALRYGVNHD